MPSFGDIDFRLLETDGSAYLTGNLFDGHHPEETVALGHCRINEAGTDIGDGDFAASLESLLAQGFHVVDLVGFRCAVSRCHWFTTQPASRGDGYEVAVTLLFEDVVERINNERPARDISVHRRAFQRVVKRGVDFARA